MFPTQCTGRIAARVRTRLKAPVFAQITRPTKTTSASVRGTHGCSALMRSLLAAPVAEGVRESRPVTCFVLDFFTKRLGRRAVHGVEQALLLVLRHRLGSERMEGFHAVLAV